MKGKCSDDSQAEALDGGEFFRGIREQKHIGNAEGTEALCASSVEFCVGGNAIHGFCIGFRTSAERRIERIVIAMDV